MSIRIPIQFFALVAVAVTTAFAQTVDESPPSSWTRSIDLELMAPNSNRFGNSWDFNPGESPFVCVPHTPACAGTSRVGSDRPDMWLMIVDSEGHIVGYQATPEERAARPTRGFIDRVLNPAQANSLARCPDASICKYRDLRVPDGAFGVVVLDQDLTVNDFMLAGVVYDAGKVDDVTLDRIEEHIRAYLDSLHGKLTGALTANEPIELRASKDCTAKMCFLDELGGIPGVRLTLAPAVTPGVRCSEATISGTLTWDRAVDGSVKLRFDEKSNACRGTLEFFWDFGDGDDDKTSDSAISHQYDGPGDYHVSVTPTCAQRTRSCQGAQVINTITIK